MSTMTAAELERSVDNLRSIVHQILGDLDRLKGEMALTEATLSHHKHDFTRDITSPPSTYAPSTHTHAYASSTHTHSYQDAQVSGLSSDVSRTTGAPI
jgi:hypothetical protein